MGCGFNDCWFVDEEDGVWRWTQMLAVDFPPPDKFLPSLRDNEIMDDLFEIATVLPKALYRVVSAPVVRRVRNRQHNGSAK